MNETTSAADFIVDDCFVDDDLLTSEDYSYVRTTNKQDQHLKSQKSFLERDNFETELGTVNDDPFAENFAEFENNDIIDVFGEDIIARPVVVIYAHRFPLNKGFDHDKFLRFVKYTLDKIVEQDYTIIYFHYGLRSNNKPPLKWLIRAYQLLDRRYRKNLKALYVVHPTKFIRFIWNIFKPIISLKFEQKLHYINSLEELNAIIPTTNLNLPQPIIDFDRSSNLNVQNDNQPQRQINLTARPTHQFNVPLKFILDHNPNSDIPPIATQLIDFIREHGLSMEGIFRRSVNINTIKSLQNRINMGEKINFLDDLEINGDLEKCIMHASVLLKTFLRSLGEPLTTNRLYTELILLSSMEKSNYLDATRELLQKLPLENYLLLKKVIDLLTDVAKHSEQNLMTANNLSIIFGPVLHWPTDRQVPMAEIRSLNAFSYNLILNYNELFCDNH